MKKQCLSLRSLFLAGLLLTGNAWCQAPDLTLNQTTGVNESDFFYLGPTGAKGWMYWSDLTLEARQILVTSVRAGTPAAGVLQYHDVILGIDGGLFTNDARTAFVDAVVAAEGSGNGGQLDLTVFRPSIAATNALVATNTLTVYVQELGTRNEATTPYNCPWADGVLSNYCEYVFNNGPTGGSISHPSIWTMLGSGIPKYYDWACNYITNASFATRTNLDVFQSVVGFCTWYRGYEAITLGEYYLKTGDASVLPALEDVAHYIAQGQDRHGIWGHTFAWPQNNGGELHGTLPGYGAINNAGLTALYGMVLAKKCGINDPEINAAVEKGAHFFRSHVNIGSINYGFHEPVEDVTDSNGRMGIAAHLFRALGEKETAKWFTMMTASYKLRDWGHTGNELNHCWGPTASNIGGPALANWTHTTREVKLPYWLVSLVMRHQWEGYFQSQDQGGMGAGAQNGRATGGYGLQLAGNRAEIEITGAGYSTNDYWLTEEEMRQVRFAHYYESSSNTDKLKLLSTPELVTNLNNYCPKIAYKVADALKPRVVTNAALRADIVAIVENAGAPANERVAALKALGSSNVLVKATTYSWFYPSQGYVLNWGAAKFGVKKTDVDCLTNMLAAITMFDPESGFDMLTVRGYANAIYNMDVGLLNEAGLEIYYDAAAVIMDPDVGGMTWVLHQDVDTWDPLIIARYADSILRSAEQLDSGYDALGIMSKNQIGEGMHSTMVRASDYNADPNLSPNGDVSDYGEHWSYYSNYTHYVNTYNVYGAYSEDRWYPESWILDFTCKEPRPALKWFRDLVSTNIENAVTNPATRLADLRYNMTVGLDDDLFHAVCLDKIVSHPDNGDPFIDITNAVGSTVMVPGSHWRLRRAAVELGVADTNAVSRWLTALADADSDGNHTLVAGILHVLAGKDAPEALPVAVPYVTNTDGVVAMAALDVMAHVGTKDELLMVFENYMTNSYIVDYDENDNPTGYFKDSYWMYAHWDAIKGIADRDYAGCLTVADQLAASFNAYTAANPSSLSTPTIPYSSLIRTRPFSVLSPVPTQREVVGWGNGVFAALGLFAKDNTACWNALAGLSGLPGAAWYGKGCDYWADDALLGQFSIPEIVAIENAGGTNLWSESNAIKYLYDQLVMRRVAVTNQLELLEVRNGKYQDSKAGIGLPMAREYQRQMDFRRGLEESEGAFFFSVD